MANQPALDTHRIAEYYTARRALRTLGWGSIIFGAINIYLGVSFGINANLLNIGLALIGVALLVAGVWCLAVPGAGGILANGIALIIVGLWNIFITVAAMGGGRPPHLWWAIFGVFQIAAAMRGFQKYARYSKALSQSVSRDEIVMMNDLVNTILRADVKNDDTIVAFQVRAFSQEKNWRGQLGRDVAIFVEKLTREVLVGDRSQVVIRAISKTLIGSAYKASVRIGEHEWKALIASTSFDRFNEWKEAENGPDDKHPPHDENIKELD